MKWIQDLHSNYNEFNDTYINYFTDLCLYAFRSYLASSLYILGVNRWHCGSVSLIKAYYMCRYLQCYFYTALKRGCFGGSVDTIFKVLFCIYQKKKSLTKLMRVILIHVQCLVYIHVYIQYLWFCQNSLKFNQWQWNMWVSVSLNQSIYTNLFAGTVVIQIGIFLMLTFF